LGTLNDFIETLTKRKLVGIFLVLWALYFFFGALYGFYWAASSFGGYYFDIVEFLLCVLQDIVALLVAAVLLFIGLKILGIEILPSSTETQ
jgi:hypothetical protein